MKVSPYSLIISFWQLNALCSKGSPYLLFQLMTEQYYMKATWIWERNIKSEIKMSENERTMTEGRGYWWVWECLLRLLMRLNFAEQCWHENGFSPVWVKRWFLRWAFWAKRKGQLGHMYGFSPVCVLMWTFRLYSNEALNEHCGHWYGLSPVWVRRWITRLLLDAVW